MDSLSLHTCSPELVRLLMRTRINFIALHFTKHLEKGVLVASSLFLILVVINYFYIVPFFSFELFALIFILFPVIASIFFAKQYFNIDSAYCARKLDNFYATKSLFQSALGLGLDGKIVSSSERVVISNAERIAQGIKSPSVFTGLKLSSWGRASIYVIIFSVLLFYFSPVKLAFLAVNEADMHAIHSGKMSVSQQSVKNSDKEMGQSEAVDNDLINQKTPNKKQSKLDAKSLFDELKNDEKVSLFNKHLKATPELAEKTAISNQGISFGMSSGTYSDISTQNSDQRKIDKKLDREKGFLPQTFGSQDENIKPQQKQAVFRSNTEKYARGSKQSFDTTGASSNIFNKPAVSESGKPVIMVPANITPQLKQYLTTFFTILDTQNELK